MLRRGRVVEFTWLLFSPCPSEETRAKCEGKEKERKKKKKKRSEKTREGFFFFPFFFFFKAAGEMMSRVNADSVSLHSFQS